MIAVVLVLPFQKIVLTYWGYSVAATFLFWAFLEEVFKYFAAYFTALRSKVIDEPIDIIIYMITAALGFAALENTLFLVQPLIDGNIPGSIITGNLRFIGATLLHIISSSVVGFFIAFSLHKRKLTKRLSLFVGLIFAIVLHTVFNLFIMNASGSDTFIIFSVLWFIIAILLLFFEKIKTIH